MNKLFTLLSSALLATGAWAQNLENGHEYVDLGLSVKWATCNLGATSPEAAGNYLSWGETSPKANYTWSTYLSDLGGTMTRSTDAGTDKDPLNEYVYDGSNYSTDGIKGTKFDVAKVKLGNNWRMPTLAEFAELANTNNCTWKWYEKGNIEFNGVAGYKITSMKEGYIGQYIFLPAAGYQHKETVYGKYTYGYYWTATPSSVWAEYAYDFDFYSNGIRPDHANDRYYGHTVRPVCTVEKTPTAIESINTNNASKVTKTIENGQIIIIRNNKKFDLSGREL